MKGGDCMNTTIFYWLAWLGLGGWTVALFGMIGLWRMCQKLYKKVRLLRADGQALKRQLKHMVIISADKENCQDV